MAPDTGLSSPRRDYVQPPNNAKREARAKARHASQVRGAQGLMTRC